MQTLFTKLNEKQIEIEKARNLALDFADSIHPENKALIMELDIYIANCNRKIEKLSN